MFGDLIAPTHLIFVLIVALLIFGPKRLPELAKGFGRGVREFKNGIEGIDDGEEPSRKKIDKQ
ncbi:MAG: twin-arginine translocase TatA/TatE family subunit [Thermoleophilia bacterium]